jgi:hypothetical protein
MPRKFPRSSSSAIEKSVLPFIFELNVAMLLSIALAH